MNLFEGRGYVGMLNNGTQLNFPPLYPISIAVVSLVTGDAEIAARAINVVLAALLVIPMFSIAEQVYGWRAAVAVAALVVLHPVLIAAGASTYAEGPYLTLTAFATMYLVRWMEHRRVVQAIAAGTFLGLAYLVRPEAFLTVGMFVAGGLMMALVRRERRTALIATLSLIAAFAVVAAPNVVFLTATTGQFRLQAKGTLSYYWGERMNRGMSYMESALGIGPELQEVGVFMRPNLEVMQST
jgi:4-amino-4-deoxy-L-arabinose transferase-like glycosyltransferase